MSKKEDIEFLKACQEELRDRHEILTHLDRWDFVTTDRILSDVPSKVDQDKMLAKYAKRLFSMAKKTKSPIRANRLKRCAGLLSDSDFRSKRAARLVARKKRLAELSVKRMAEQTDAANARAGRAALLAVENGFDGRKFTSLAIDDDPTSLQSRRRLREQFETIPIIIAKMEKSEEEEQKVSLTDNELQLLYDMANHENECRHRYIISTATEIPESTLKTILKAFEEKGWIDHPKGSRKGFTITVEGLRIYENISAD